MIYLEPETRIDDIVKFAVPYDPSRQTHSSTNRPYMYGDYSVYFKIQLSLAPSIVSLCPIAFDFTHCRYKFNENLKAIAIVMDVHYLDFDFWPNKTKDQIWQRIGTAISDEFLLSDSSDFIVTSQDFNKKLIGGFYVNMAIEQFKNGQQRFLKNVQYVHNSRDPNYRMHKISDQEREFLLEKQAIAKLMR